MRRNTEDKTLEKNYIQKWRFLIKQYELTKTKKHHQFRFVTDFYKFHGTNRQTFLKYYHRFKNSGKNENLLPRKRGPKWHSRRPLPYIENKVIEQRKLGINRYEIQEILKPKLKSFTPSPSGIYNICKRYGLNRLTKPMKQSKRQIIKERAGELAHIDCHYLPKELILNESKRYYLVAVVDSCTRVAWAELVSDIKSLTVMFSVMRCFQIMQKNYNIQFEEALTDNGAEFGQGLSKNNQMTNPFKRMLYEMEIKHRCIKPYRPQTNGKVERFWRTIEEDMIQETTFDTLEDFQKDLFEYLIYYNEYRPHQGINGKKPAELNQILSTN
jgi:hypothetical protein